MIKDLLAGERYARAVFEIASTMGRDKEIGEELENFCAALESNSGFKRLFSSPFLKIEQKRVFLEKIYPRSGAVSGLLLDFLTVLFEKDRFSLIDEIALNFKRISDEAQGQAVAQICSAAPLAVVQEAAIVKRLEEISGYKIVVKKEVDASLIGGVVVKIKNRIINGSVRHQIDYMKNELIKISGV